MNGTTRYLTIIGILATLLGGSIAWNLTALTRMSRLERRNDQELSAIRQQSERRFAQLEQRLAIFDTRFTAAISMLEEMRQELRQLRTNQRTHGGSYQGGSAPF